jgi:hypothetical protein
MHCEDFEARVNEVLDARQPLSSASDLSEHIRQCAPCRSLARAYEAMLVGFEQSEVPPEPASLTPRVLSQLGWPDRSIPGRSIAAQPAPSTRSHVLAFPIRGAIAVAAAAVLLAAIGLPLLFNRGVNLAKDDQSAGDHLTGQEHAPRIAKTDQPSPAVQSIPSDQRPQHRRRGIAAVARTPLATAFVIPSQLKADDLIDALPAAGWAHDVADGLEPVTKPTVGAINGFLQLWGVGDEGRRS